MRKSVFLLTLSITIGILLGAPARVLAQATGTVAGVVTDDSGAVLPGATITVTSSATAQARTVTTRCRSSPPGSSR